MTSNLAAALSAFAAGIVLQNVILARAFCTDDLLRSTRTYGAMLRMGYSTGVVTMISMLAAWCAHLLFNILPTLSNWRWLIYFFCVILGTVIYHMLPGRFKMSAPIPGESLHLTYTAICSMAYGIVLITMANYTSFLQALLYALGCCIGMVAAQMLIHAGHERIGLSLVPKSFTGMPILLIYIGILSLAIYGLIGHQLPT